MSVRISKLGVAPVLLAVCVHTLTTDGITYKLSNTRPVKEGLYTSKTGDILSLSNDTFQTRVIDSAPDKFWMVQFYNSWCGHCINFAPTYKKVAKDLRDWQHDEVSIAAIDCSEADYMPTCRMWDIQKYPTIRIFPPVGMKSRLKFVKTVDSEDQQIIKRRLYEYIVDYGPSQWTVKPVKRMEDIWQDKTAKHTLSLLVVEKDGSFLGVQVILDLRHHSSLLIHAMRKQDATKYNITEYPSLYKVETDSSYKLVVAGVEDELKSRRLFVEKSKALVEDNNGTKAVGIDVERTLRPVHKEHINGSSLEIDDHTEQNNGVVLDENNGNVSHNQASGNISTVSMQDLESALHYSFRQEVSVCKSLDNDKLAALLSFVRILVDYFPGRPMVMGFLNKVLQMLKGNPANMSGEEWLDSINKLQDTRNFLPDKKLWVSCEGSSPRYRGYPCALWCLFHTLSVNHYVLSSKSNVTSHSTEVLTAIKSYMKHFFGCEECANFFVQEANSVETQIKSARDSVLWLWATHNKVNMRLQGDVSEDPKHPKIQFPSYDLCKLCYKSISVEHGKPSWNGEQVLNFLVNFYGKVDIHSNGSSVGNDAANRFIYNTSHPSNVRSNVTEVNELDWWENQQNQRLSGRSIKDTSLTSLWGVPRTDLGVCAAFYVTSAVIIVFFYKHFILRRQKSLYQIIRGLG